MPLYEIDGRRPTLPADGGYYVADDATLIGSVTLGAGATAAVFRSCQYRWSRKDIVLFPESTRSSIATAPSKHS